MAERNERQALHHLIEVCKDGERGFLAAEAAVSKPALKSLFRELALQRCWFAQDLAPHLRRLGGTADGDGTTAGALHRTWIKVKAHAPLHHDRGIVVEAERGERVARAAYDHALHRMLPPTATGLIEAQQQAMHEAIDRIRAIELG